MGAGLLSSFPSNPSKGMQTSKRPAGNGAAHILVVDDEPSMLRYLRTLLEVDSFNVTTAGSGEEALQQMQQGLSPDLVLLDSFMPGIDGIELLRQLRTLTPEIKVVMLSCVNDNRRVVQAMRLGARDFISKPFRKQDLDDAIAGCLNLAKRSSDGEMEGEEIHLEADKFFVFGSPVMKEIKAQATLVARVDLPVLLLGESGTGKEVLAHFVHKMSPRANRIFTKVNCAAVPPDLLESELFGYEAGAFTGANRPKPGKFEICNNGTILLDEIGEMHPALQAKLLHVLQDGTFSRLGSRTTVKVDVRVLAATNIDIKQAIAQKTFREDLYYRLNGFTMQLPPLRERIEEVPLLIRHFMGKLAEKYARQPLPLSHALADACMAHPWPGNLRELENFVKRYLVLGDEQMMIAELTPKKSATSFAAEAPGNGANQNGQGLKKLVRGLKDEAEAEAIAQALEKTRWNRKQAAAELKISYKALLYKVRQYGLEPPPRMII
jgi:two-component system, NtrC family, response regulator AtoC